MAKPGTTDDCQGSKRLIAEVIRYSVEDIRLMAVEKGWKHGRGHSQSAFNARLRDFISARLFFLRDEPLNWMCAYVNLDPDVVRERMEPEIENAVELGIECGRIDSSQI